MEEEEGEGEGEGRRGVGGGIFAAVILAFA